MIQAYLSDQTQNNTPFVDELVGPEGALLPQWDKLAKSYEKLGESALNSKSQEVIKLLRENGVTYNIYGDPDGLNRPWMLDPVPLIFSQKDWSTIEQGLQQRAQLLNLILQDIYGSRSLIKEGILPFEMIYNHKGFLRQMDKIKIPGPQQLVQYSADLARGPNGKMWVLHDRADAPSGAGYTFENRVAMTRVFPEMLRENHVRKIGGYYQTLKSTLTRLAWQGKENPRVVFLTPGPGNETYFEHAYLSAFMGFTLATGADLTVNDGYVWLKTMSGLEKVDVIVRRVDDIFCDPLELRQDSHLGVVGLMEAIRQEKVLVINPLGTRILENPGLLAFLPRICKHLLNEDLILPSVATWWCGHEREKKYVLDNLRHLMVRKIYRSTLNRSVFGGDLTNEQLDKLTQEIKTRPYLYVGQEVVNFSTTPSFIDGKLEARNAVFRSYVVADAEKQSYYVMPGGLSRSSPNKGVFIVSNQSGGISKDTWVLGTGEREPEITSGAQMVPETHGILPSRTGENLFWLGRYLERAIYSVRLLRIALKKYYETEDDQDLLRDEALITLLKTLSATTGTLPGFQDDETLQDPEKELLSLITDTQRSGSLNHSILSFLNNAYAVRDRLSLDTWRILETISEESQLMRGEKELSRINRNLDTLIIKLMAFHGLNIDNMTRETTWNILNVGRFLESTQQACKTLKSMLAVKHKNEVERSILEFLLVANESLVTYRYMYRSTLELPGTLNLLITDELNPRSLVYLVLHIDQHMAKMPNDKDPQMEAIRRKLLDAYTRIRLVNLQDLSGAISKKGKRKVLYKFMEDLILLMKEVSVLINEQYFSHVQDQYGFVSTKLPEV